jgi:cellobiose epimerase
MSNFEPDIFYNELEKELKGNILPFWMAHTVDRLNGGFFGGMTNDLDIHNEEPRSAILCARILWTYSAAYRRYGDKEYLCMAQWAYDYLRKTFWDPTYGGVYWTVDFQGQPVFDRKHHYAQAFAIYGLSEYYRAAREPESLELAQQLFHLLEKYGVDRENGGYIEGSSREWEILEDMRLSSRDLDCRKSMNTHLHILEAYTNLMRVWDEPELKSQHRALIEIFFEHIIDGASGHLKLFFDDSWNSLLPHVSYGHDIEASWLLVEAAEMQNDPALLKRAGEMVVKIAEAVRKDGLAEDGSLPYESGPEGLVDPLISWWVQAEAMVGFYNAYQISGQAAFAETAYHSWEYIQKRVIDRTYGDWFKRLNPDGSPEEGALKTGPWECPYHHSRACYEMMDRLRIKKAG